MEEEKIMFDYDKLRKRIKEYYKNEAYFAKQLDVSSTQLSYLLNNKAEWSIYLIDKACSLLNIIAIEIPLYFFTEKIKQI